MKDKCTIWNEPWRIGVRVVEILSYFERFFYHSLSVRVVDDWDSVHGRTIRVDPRVLRPNPFARKFDFCVFHPLGLEGQTFEV